jgi:ribosomal protein L2
LLTASLRKHGGRNSHGRITVRFRGGGHKRRVRLIDFVRTEPGEYDVVRIEYDPGRSAHIALIKARDPKAEGKTKWKYILATEAMRPGDVVQSFRMGMPDETGVLRARTVRPGNVLPIRSIPTGTVIHCVSLSPTGKALLVRSAGSFAQVVHHDESGRYSHVRLQSGEVRKVLQDCCATIGRVSNLNWKGRKIGKAGRNRWLGWRPRVRGVAMNASVPSLSQPCAILSRAFTLGFLARTILMVVDVVNPSPTNILSLSGAGPRRASAPVNLVPRVPRIAIRWSFVSDLGARKSARVVHRVFASLYLSYCIETS